MPWIVLLVLESGIGMERRYRSETIVFLGGCGFTMEKKLAYRFGNETLATRAAESFCKTTNAFLERWHKKDRYSIKEVIQETRTA